MRRRSSRAEGIARSPYYWGTVLVVALVFAFAGWTFGLWILVATITVGTAVDVVVGPRRT